MDKILNELKLYGADIDGAMGRFLGDEELYKLCFEKILNDESFKELGAALEKQDYEKAFEHAHSMKGTTGNMGLTPIYLEICEIVSELRQKEYSNLKTRYIKVMEQLETLKKIK